MIAARNFSVYKAGALTWTAAGIDDAGPLGANSLLQWEAMRTFAEEGIEWLETGEGFPGASEPKLRGLSEFKQSFGGNSCPLSRPRCISALAACASSTRCKLRLMSTPIGSSSRTVSEASSNRIYDRLADTYGYAVDGSAGASLKYRLVLRYVSPTARVLDVGCANGLHLRKIAPHCREIVGIDINARMLNLAKTALLEDRAGNAVVLGMSATRLELDAEMFDVA